MSFFEKFAQRIGKTKNVLAYAEAGRVSAQSFTGSPLKTTVTLSQAQPSADYSVTIMGEDLRAWTVESKTTTSFVINSNASTTLSGVVSWMLGGNI